MTPLDHQIDNTEGIRVLCTTPAESIYLQQIFINKGYTWPSHRGTSINEMLVGITSLYFSSDYKKITKGGDDHHFKTHPFKQLTIADIRQLQCDRPYYIKLSAKRYHVINELHSHGVMTKFDRSVLSIIKSSGVILNDMEVELLNKIYTREKTKIS